MTSKEATPFRHVHWHPEMEILYMLQGEAEVRIGKQILPFHQGDIALIHPGEFHAIRPLGPNCSHTAFVFSLDLFTFPDPHFFQAEVIHPLRTGSLHFPQHITPAHPAYPAVSAELDRIHGLKSTAGDSRYTIFGSLFSLFILLSAHSETNADGADPHNETVKQCVGFMEANLHRRITLSEIAGIAHLHPNYLCKLFRTYTGQTVFEYLNRIRVEKAAALLRTEEISVGQAATECGFESLSFFTRKFRTVMGVTPKHYRLKSIEEMRENRLAK